MMRRWNSLRLKLVLLVGAGTLPLVVLFLLLGDRYYQYAVANANKQVADMARLAAGAHEAHLREVRQLLEVLGRVSEIRGRRPGYCATLAHVWKQQAGMANLGMVDADGKGLCSSARADRVLGFLSETWYAEGIRQGGFFVGDYRIGSITGKPVAVAVLPLLGDDGRMLGALYAALDLRGSGRFDVMSALPAQSVLVMFDDEGVVLQRLPDDGQWIGKRLPRQPLFAAMRARGRSGVLESPSLDGRQRLFAFESFDSRKGMVHLAVGIPTEMAYVLVRKELTMTAVGVSVAQLVMLGVTLFAGEYLLGRRVAGMTSAARRFARGDYAACTGLTNQSDEIGELAVAMDMLAEAVQVHERELSQYLRAFNEHAIVSETDAGGTIVYVNDKFCEISQYAREELIGQNHRLLNSGYHLRHFFEEMWETISHGQVWHGDIRNRRKDGRYYWVASTIVPFLDQNGLPVRYFSIRTDITHVLAIDEALLASEQRFRQLAENAQDVISLHDLDGRLTYISPSCERVLAYTQAEMVGRDGYDFVHPDDAEMVRRDLHEPVLRGEAATCDYIRLRRKEGAYIWIEASATPSRDQAGQVVGIQVFFRDVSTRKHAEDVLHLHDRAIAASASGIAIFRCDDWVIEYVNGAFAHMVDVPDADLAGQRWPVLSSTSASEGEWRSVQEAVAVGSECHALLKGVTRQGAHVWCDIFVSPVCNDKGSVTHYVAALVDMTERVAMEAALVLAKEAAEKASQAKSEFLSHISHELRTPLNAIVGFAQLLEIDSEAPLNEEQKDIVDRILSAGWLLRDLVNDVLDLSRIEADRLQLVLEDVNVSNLVGDCLGMIAGIAAERRLEIVDLSSECKQLTVHADAMRMKQVLINLLSNAVKYNREGGRVMVACNHLGDGGVCITVSDTGIGIPMEKHGDLFQYFNRLKVEKTGIPGVGVGLALCQRLVELMGGTIGVESIPGEGSAFWVMLPGTSGKELGTPCIACGIA